MGKRHRRRSRLGEIGGKYLEGENSGERHGPQGSVGDIQIGEETDQTAQGETKSVEEIEGKREKGDPEQTIARGKDTEGEKDKDRDKGEK
jgi:hypothetical protein